MVIILKETTVAIVPAVLPVIAILGESPIDRIGGVQVKVLLGDGRKQVLVQVFQLAGYRGFFSCPAPRYVIGWSQNHLAGT